MVKIQWRLFFFISCLIIHSSSAGAKISKTEQKIISAVDKRTTAAKVLLENVVNINSGTMNFKGVQKVGTIFMKELISLGFETHWVPGEAFNRAGHLIAIHNGKKGRKILLIGHLDTVFDLESPFQTFEMLNDSILHGPGASDMKGGDVIIILALQALRDAGLLADMNLEIVLTGDEESSGSPLALSKKDLIEAGERADIALCYEDGDGLASKAVVSRRGAASWTLTVKGNAAHSSQIFTEKVGAGAIFETSRILNECYSALSKEVDFTFSPGLIVGGNYVHFDSLTNSGTASGKNNIVSQDVFVKGDLRAISTEQLLRAKKKMSEIVDHNYPKTTATIHFEDEEYPPMSSTKGNINLLGYYNQVSIDLGYGPQTQVNPRDAGAADICFVNDKVDMALDGIGMPGSNGHTINETANINYLPIEAKRSAILIYRLTQNLEKE